MAYQFKHETMHFQFAETFLLAILDLQQEDIIYSISFGSNLSYKIFELSQSY